MTQNTGHTFKHLDWLWFFLFKWILSASTKYFASWIGWNIEILIVLSCSFLVLNTRDFLTAGRTRIQRLVVTGRLNCGSIFNLFSLIVITISDRTLIYRHTNPNILCLVNSGSIQSTLIGVNLSKFHVFDINTQNFILSVTLTLILSSSLFLQVGFWLSSSHWFSCSCRQSTFSPHCTKNTIY